MPHEVEVVRTSSILIKHEEIVTSIYFFVGMNDECIHSLFHSLFSLESPIIHQRMFSIFQSFYSTSVGNRKRYNYIIF